MAESVGGAFRNPNVVNDCTRFTVVGKMLEKVVYPHFIITRLN